MLPWLLAAVGSSWESGHELFWLGIPRPMPSSEWVSSSSWADRPNPPERPSLPSKEHHQHTHTSDPGTQILVLKQCGRELVLRMSVGDWDWNPHRKVLGRTTLGPELRERLMLSSLPCAWSACWSCPQPGFLSREEQTLSSVSANGYRSAAQGSPWQCALAQASSTQLE